MLPLLALNSEPCLPDSQVLRLKLVAQNPVHVMQELHELSPEDVPFLLPPSRDVKRGLL